MGAGQQEQHGPRGGADATEEKCTKSALASSTVRWQDAQQLSYKWERSRRYIQEWKQADATQSSSHVAPANSTGLGRGGACHTQRYAGEGRESCTMNQCNRMGVSKMVRRLCKWAMQA